MPSLASVALRLLAHARARRLQAFACFVSGGWIKYFQGRRRGRACAVCGQVAQKFCAGCAIAVYCSRECQRKHWRLHKENCLNWRHNLGQAMGVGRPVSFVSLGDRTVALDVMLQMYEMRLMIS